MIDRLLEEPGAFDFFQAVRLLERAAARSRPRNVSTAVGRDADPREEAVRFGALPSRAFPGSAIARAVVRPESTAGAPQTELTVAFLGLTGPAGILPHHVTSLVLSRLRERDHVLRDFFDLFHHRTISFFYRAWEKYRFAFNYERSRYDADHADLFTRGLIAITGCGTIPPQARRALADETFLFYAGLFSDQHRSALALERMLAGFLEAHVEVRQFVGHWQTLSPEDRTQLPRGLSREGQYHCLGSDAVIGERIWELQGRFRVVLGPLDYERFCDFLPTGRSLLPAVQLTRAYVGGEFDFEVQVLLEAASVPPCRLGSNSGRGARLGWDTWIWAKPFQATADDAVFCVADDSLDAEHRNEATQTACAT